MQNGSAMSFFFCIVRRRCNKVPTRLSPLSRKHPPPAAQMHLFPCESRPLQASEADWIRKALREASPGYQPIWMTFALTHAPRSALGPAGSNAHASDVITRVSDMPVVELACSLLAEALPNICRKVQR